jgi:hypothetical protein
LLSLQQLLLEESSSSHLSQPLQMSEPSMLGRTKDSIAHFAYLFLSF